MKQFNPAARQKTELDRADLDAEIDSAVSRLLSTTGPIAPAPAPASGTAPARADSGREQEPAADESPAGSVEQSAFEEQIEPEEAAVDFSSPGHFSLPEMAALGRPVARPEFSAISARFAAVAFLALLVGVSVLDLG